MTTNPPSGAALPVPESLMVSTRNMPFADDFGAAGVRMQVLHCDVDAGMFAVRILFAPGVQLPPHHHTGTVHAWTMSGEWTYLEHGDAPPNIGGSYLYEPAGTTHTLKIADHNTGETDVFFIIYGAMLILDAQGKVEFILDAKTHLNAWPEALRAQGKPVPAMIAGGSVRYTTEA